MKFHLIFVFIFLAVDLSQAVTIPPKITKQGPKDIFYKPFETVKILCEAVGFPALTYKWMRADKDYTPQGNDDRVVQQTGVGTLIINSPEDKDEGLYQCLASNGHGTAATVKFNLKMAKLKEFATSDPIYHNNINLGEPLTLNCQSPDSVPDAQIYWAININGVIKPVSWNARVTMDYEDRLHFTHVTEEDRQNGHPYQCVAYNALMRKSVMGPPHYIQPQGTNPIMSPMKSAWPNNRFDEVGLLGTTHKLKCIYSGNPTPNVKWMRQGYDAEHLKTNPRVLTGNSGGQELVIKDLQFEDSGTYICQATKDQEPKPQEMSINLNINASPRWVAKPEDVTTSEETTAQISCLAEGVPKPKIEWFVNGEKLEDALRNDFRLDPRRFHKLEESRVVMEYLTIADSMVFQCNVSNIHGYLWGEAFLNVLNEPPTILVPPQAVLKVAEGQPFTMTCVVTGKPEATITWRKNDMQVTGGRFVVLEEGSLVVKVSTLADAGEYRCHAENKNGTAEASGVLVVRRKTVIEWKPRDIEVQRPTNAKFTCSGTTDPEEAENLETIWLKDTKPVELGTRMFKNIQDHSLTISGTEQEDTGTYTCVVTNGLDNATASARLVVTDVPDAPVWVAINNSCRAMPNQCFPPGNKSCQTQPVAEVVWMPGSFNNAPIQYFTVEYMTTQDPNHWVFAEQVDYIKAKAFIPLSPGMKYFFRVTSYNKIGASKPSQRSNDSCETSDKLPLYNPRNVRTIGDKPGKVHIEWTPVPPEHQGHMNFSYLVSYKRVGDPNSAWNKHQISDWKISDYIFSNTGTPYQAYLISVISTNSMGESADAVNVVTGHSDESIPLVWPTDLQTLDIQSDRVTFQWKFDHTQIGKVDSKLRGEFRGFKIQYWEENHIEETIRETDILPEQFVNITNDIFNGTVRNVFPNTQMQARVSVLNLFFVSKPSGVIDFVTPPGLPGPVQYMEDINIGDNHINLQWYTPLDNRDDIIGYDIGYREVDGLHMSEMQERNPQIDDPYTTSAMLSGLLPSTKYRIYIWARTAQGRGDEFYIERTTAAPGELRIPRFTISGIGHDFINVSWWRDAYIDSSSVVYVQYKKDDGAEWFSTSPDVSRDWVKVSFLEAGIWYNIRIVVTNGDSMRLSEQEDVLTDGEAKAYDVAANLGWFLALIFAILLQIALVIILIICYRKGHYFKTQQKQTRAYDSRENTYSGTHYNEAEIPRHSKEFGPEPGGFSNDYYWNGYDRDRDSQDGVYKDHFQGKGDYEYDDDRYHNPNYSDYPPYEYDNSEGGEPLQRGEKKRLSSFKNHNVYEDYGNEEEEGDVSYHKSDMSDNNSFPPPPSDLDSERGGRGHYEGLSSTEERRMESRGAQARNNRDTSDNRYSHDSPHDDRRTQHYHRRQEDSRRTHDHHHQHREPHSDEHQDGRSHPNDYDHHRNDYDHRRDRNRSRHDDSHSYSGDEADDSHHHGHHSNRPGHDHEKCQEVVDEFKRYSGSEMSHEVGSVDSGRRKPPTDTFV